VWRNRGSGEGQVAEFSDENFDSQTIDLDGNRYVRCNFNKCTMIYSGGAIPVLQHCNFTGETWRFEGAAERTLTLLQEFSRAGSGFEALVRGCFPALYKPN
jgi:hypothetical protein